MHKILALSFLVLSSGAFAGSHVKLLWSEREISVCFAPGEEGERIDKYGGYALRVKDWTPDQKTWMEKWVKEEFTPERTGIHFVGFRDCHELPGAEVVLFKSKTGGLSNIMTTILGGVVGWAGLGAHTYNVEGFPAAKNYVVLRSSGIKKAFAIHEFGHVVGLGHEHEHPQAVAFNKKCQSVTKPARDSIYVYTEFDSESIMSYCNVEDTRRGLSQSDVMLIRRLYL